MRRVLNILAFGALAAFLIISDAANARVLRIPSQYPDFVQAYIAAQPGDTILFEIGVHEYQRYPDPLTMQGLTILGEDLNSTILQNGSYFRISSPDTTFLIKNLTFIGGAPAINIINGCRIDSCIFRDGNISFAIKADGNYIIRNCKIYNYHPTGYIGAILAYGGGETRLIEYNCIHDNSAIEGGAIYVSDNNGPTIRFNLIYNNSASESGGAIYFFYENISPVYNNTFSGNSSPIGSAIYLQSNVVPSETIRNNIFANNTDGFAIYNANNACVFGECNAFWDNAIGDVGKLSQDCGNPDGVNDCIKADPLFCNAPAFDYTIDYYSPCANDPSCGQIGALGAGCSDQEYISTPTITGPTSGIPWQVLWFTAENAASSEGHTLEYQWDWDFHEGPNDPSQWSTDSTKDNQYPSEDIYNIRVHARCQLHPERISYWSEPLTLVIGYTEGSIAGTVSDASTGLAVPNANMRALQGGQEIETDVTNPIGQYALTGLPIATYDVEAGAIGYYPQTAFGISVVGGQETIQNFSLEPLPTSGNLEGFITDYDSSIPIENASVFIQEYLYYSDKSDAAGYYHIHNIPEGTYHTIIRASGYQELVVADLEIIAGSTTFRDFQVIKRASSLRLSIKTEDNDDKISPGDHFDLVLTCYNDGGEANDIQISLNGYPSSSDAPGVMFLDEATNMWGHSHFIPISEIPALSNTELTISAFVERVDPDDFPAGHLLPRLPSIEISSSSHQELNGPRELMIRPVEFQQLALPTQFSAGLSMVEADCIRYPYQKQIRRYAQFAAASANASVAAVYDPDGRGAVLINVCFQVNNDFNYDHSGLLAMRRQSDLDMLNNRNGNIGVCIDYSDLSTSLLRSLGLQTRDVFGRFRSVSGDGKTGHAWNEVLLSESGSQDAWIHFDATMGVLDNKDYYWIPQSTGGRGLGYPIFVFADIVPLSNIAKSSLFHDTEIQGVIQCNPAFASYDCEKCRLKFWPIANLILSSEDIESEYHPLGFHFNTEKSLQNSIAMGNDITITIDSPAHIEVNSPFQLVAKVSNYGGSVKRNIVIEVDTLFWAEDTISSYSTNEPTHFIDSLTPGGLDSALFVITPSRALRESYLTCSAYDQDSTFFIEEIVRHNINEVGSLPDIILITEIAEQSVQPPQSVPLIAKVLDCLNEVIGDASVTVVLSSLTHLGVEDTVQLGYSEANSTYTGEVELLSDYPIGIYCCKFLAEKVGFEPDSIEHLLEVSPAMSIQVTEHEETYDCGDSVQLDITIYDRCVPTEDASMDANISTPVGNYGIPVVSNGDGTYFLSFVPSDAVAGLGSSILIGGQWTVDITAESYDAIAEITTDIEILVPDLSVNTEDLQVSPRWPKEGNDVLISAIIKNLGNSTSDSAFVKFFIDGFGPLDQVGGDYSIPELVPGQIAQVLVVWSTEGKIGEHTVYVQIDGTEMAVDSDRSNNECSINITVLEVCDCTGLCDLNRDGQINPVDVVYIVNYVYKNLDMREQIISCPLENGDWNCDSMVNPVDCVYYVNYVYKSLGEGPCDPCSR